MYNINQVFCYKGKLYGKNTKIKIKQSYINNHLYNNLPIWPYARYEQANINGNSIKYLFAINNLDNKSQWRKHAGFFLVDANEIDSLIEEIIYANEVHVTNIYIPQSKKDWEVKGMGIAWTIYIAVLVGSLIFREFYYIWIIATYIFFKFRKEMLKG